MRRKPVEPLLTEVVWLLILISGFPSPQPALTKPQKQPKIQEANLSISALQSNFAQMPFLLSFRQYGRILGWREKFHAGRCKKDL